MRTQRFLPILLVLSSLGLYGCGTTRIFDVPYSQVEARFLEADPALSRCLKFGAPVVQLSNKPGQSLRVMLEERYDIGAVGGRRLSIDLRKVDERRTRVAVNYVDKAVGFLVVPIAYVNPGWVRERKIARCIMEPGPTEPSCRLFQGKSCGPENAELACVSADGKVHPCVCQSTWNCR